MIHSLDYNVFRIPSIWTSFEIKTGTRCAKTEPLWTSLGFDKLKKSFIVIFEYQFFEINSKVWTNANTGVLQSNMYLLKSSTNICRLIALLIKTFSYFQLTYAGNIGVIVPFGFQPSLVFFDQQKDQTSSYKRRIEHSKEEQNRRNPISCPCLILSPLVSSEQQTYNNWHQDCNGIPWVISFVN